MTLENYILTESLKNLNLCVLHRLNSIYYQKEI